MNKQRTDLKPKEMKHYSIASKTVIDENQHWKKTTYDGKELMPFEGRKGAMDAFKLPSRGM